MSSSGRRLEDSKAFDTVFKGNEYRVSSASFLFLAMANRNDTSRLGLVIGKKSIKLATQRNRTKRALRENFRSVFSDFSPAIDLVVVSKKGIQTRDKTSLHRQINELMEKLAKKITHQSQRPNG